MSFRGIFKPGDGVLLAVIILITLIWAGWGERNSESSESLRIVTREGEDTLSLYTDTVVFRGNVTIEIKTGRAAITGSDCPTRQCVNTGWIKTAGQISACMPNMVWIEVLGEEQLTDVISY